MFPEGKAEAAKPLEVRLLSWDSIALPKSQVPSRFNRWGNGVHFLIGKPRK